MKTRNIVMIAVLVALAVAAAIALVVGVATHDEPGLADGVEPWARDRVPLQVCAESYLDTSEDALEAVEDVAAVVDDVNARLGFTVFEVAASDCDVGVIVGVPAEPGWMDPGGDARLEPGFCAVRTSNTGTVEMLALVLEHELGHCLGLGHDDYPASIMYPVASPTPDGQFPPRISDHDRALLRQLYMPR